MDTLNPIKHAAHLLSSGKIVAIPTETVYGLAGSARNPEALQKIYQIKNRPASNPLIIHLSHPPAMSDWAINIPKAAFALANHFWPGPLTMVLSKHKDVLPLITAGQDTVALRVPNHPMTLALLQALGEGLAAPSANRSGRLSPTTAAHVQEELGGKVDYILDGGPCSHGIESTIIYFQDNDVFILRQGSITAKDLNYVLNTPVRVGGPLSEKIQVPGHQFAHYAPSCPLYLLEKTALLKVARELIHEKARVGIYSFIDHALFHSKNEIVWLRAKQKPSEYAAKLYADLRTLDAHKVDCILVETPEQSMRWSAILDRLQRAAKR